MRIAVLGPVRAARDGEELDLGPRKQRAVLAGLALHAGRAVPADTLVDLVWGEAPPAAVAASLHGYVAGLRRRLEPARAARAESSVLVTADPGYRLDVVPEALDATRFARTLQEAHARLGGDLLQVAPDLGPGDLDDLDAALLGALGLWRGVPYAELEPAGAVEAERTRLGELRLTGLADRARTGLARGRAAAVAGALAPLAREHPLREDLWTLLALAFARSGRQADALAAVATAKQALADELGIDPGPALAGLELAILRQDRTVIAAADAAPTVTAAAAEPVAAPRQGLPFVGRTHELAALCALLDDVAAAGVPRTAVVLGEPGIGKTRLTSELAAVAGERGFTVLVGRCSSDEGTPPLWPWRTVLRALAEVAPREGVPDLDPLLARAEVPAEAVDRFRLFEAVTAAVTRAAARGPLLLVLDDLHWADVSTLRLLQHLVEQATGALAVVVTRRARPEPAGALRELGEALARRDALRLDLAGITAADVAALAEATGATRVGGARAEAVRDRTEGNPFFVVELLRLLAASGGVIGGPAVPASVGDVVAARVGQLPAGTRTLLEAAASAGRTLDVGLLARLLGADLEAVLDDLEPAIDAGLVAVGDDGVPRFAHALVRDAVDAGVSPLRRQRRHADLARLLEERDDSGRSRPAIARHWLRAGPAYAGRAWRTAVEAADDAAGLAAHEEAADLLRGALASQHLDPAATADDRYELLLALARACRAAGDVHGQVEAAGEAMALAGRSGDVEREAVAAAASSEGALWSSRTEGVVHDPTLRALRRALDELPVEDTALRCQVLIALTRELFWAPGRQEAEAYAERALAMARRLGDPALLAVAARAMLVNEYRPATLEHRLDLAAESLDAARRSGDREAEVLGLFWLGITCGEAGRVAEREEAVREALRLATAGRLRYLQVMLGGHDVPWLALQGRYEEAERLLEDTERWAAYAAFPFLEEAVLAARSCLELWRGNAGRLVDAAHSLDASSTTDMGTFLLLLLLRSDRLDQAGRLLDARPVPLTPDSFAATMDLAIGAEAALRLGRPALAAQVYPVLSAWPGRVAVAGTGSPLGPVDAFLALAAAAVGERELAAGHADAALALCEAWRLDSVTAWLTGLRSRYRF